MGSAMKLLLLATCLAVASSSSLPALPHEDAKSSGTCPDKWVDASFVEMGCLYFNSTETLTWDEANNMCQMGSNSTLVDITTEMQMAFLQMELNVIADHDGGGKQWWTAGTDVGINGRWIWATTLAPVEEYVFHPDHPNGDIVQCNYLLLSPAYEYLAFTQSATYKCNPICQMK